MALPAIDEWPAPRAARTGLAPPELELLLDCVTDGMIVIDRRARVLHANRPARELLGRVRAPASGTGALSFEDRPTQQAFERALARCGTRCDGPPGAAGRFLVRDPLGMTVARATLEPLRRTRLETAHASTHLVSLHPQPQAAEISAEALRGLYGLTPAEARIAAVVTVAASIDELAQRVGLSRNTVKTHLKGVFRKCEVASFAQLAALVATGPRLR